MAYEKGGYYDSIKQALTVTPLKPESDDSGERPKGWSSDTNFFTNYMLA